MRAVIQRVTNASVTIEGSVKSRIGQGFLILLGVCDEDTMEDVEWLTEAIGKPVGTGEFGADMKVELLNDGPVTICMDTKNKE